MMLALVVALAGCDAAETPPADQASDEAAVDGDPGEVNVYSHRHYEADEELFERFSERTGIEVNVVTASADELITRLENEGASSPADVLITVDAGRLHRAEERGLLQPMSSEILEANIPAELRDPEGYWFGLTRRARILAYAPERVDPGELSTYMALADDRWNDRLLIRSSENVYNQSLLASIIAAEGEEAAEQWAEGVVENMARSPQGGDTDQVKAVAAGVGDVAVVNSYYVARLMNSEDAEDQRVASAIAVFFPNQEGRGTHVNVSGAGVTAHASNPENAIRLLEFLSGEEAQQLFAEANQEYPVHPDVQPSATLREWGDFEQDSLNLSRLGELNDAAVRIFDRVGWR